MSVKVKVQSKETYVLEIDCQAALYIKQFCQNPFEGESPEDLKIKKDLWDALPDIPYLINQIAKEQSS